jgi:hypothetical protein
MVFPYSNGFGCGVGKMNSLPEKSPTTGLRRIRKSKAAPTEMIPKTMIMGITYRLRFFTSFELVLLIILIIAATHIHNLIKLRFHESRLPLRVDNYLEFSSGTLAAEKKISKKE